MRDKATSGARQWLLTSLCLFIATGALGANVSPPAGYQLFNTATVDYTDANRNIYQQDSSTVFTFVGQASSLEIVAVGSPDLVRSGNRIDYTLTITNTGNSSSNNVSVASPIPVGTTFLDVADGGTYALGQVSWSIDSLESGGQAVVHFAVTVDPNLLASSLVEIWPTAVSATDPLARGYSSNTVAGRTQGVIRFYDHLWREAGQYYIGDQICLEVTDADQNIGAQLAEEVQIRLEQYHTLADGGESVDDSLLVDLAETGNDTGVFRGCANTDGNAPSPNDTILSVATDSRVRAYYNDPLDPTPLVTDAALIDPLGIVFDAYSGAPIANVVVTLIDVDANAPAQLPQPPDVPRNQDNPVITGADGRFQFEYVNPGRYKIVCAPAPDPVYVFPSNTPTEELPAGMAIELGSRGETFELVEGMAPLNLDIPLDPESGELQLTKRVDRDNASIGDFLRYTLTVTNHSSTAAVRDVVIDDEPPHGFELVNNSSRLDGGKIKSPQPGSGGKMAFPVGQLEPGQSKNVTYVMLVGPDATRGSGINSALANGTSLGTPVKSNRVSRKVRIDQGVFTDEGVIVGRVFLDANTDSELDEGDRGIGGAVLYMENGTRVVTDESGKFSIQGIKPGNHVLRLDETSLPKGYKAVGGEGRFMGDYASTFVDMSRSGFFRAQFRVTAEGAALEISSSKDINPGKKNESDWSLEIIKMDSSPAILSPADGDFIAGDSTKVVVKGPSAGVLELWVNGKAADGDRIGSATEYGDKRILAFVGVRLDKGAVNKIELRYTSAEGVKAEPKVLNVRSAGDAFKLQIVPPKEDMKADGKTVTALEILSLDKDGALTPINGPISVSISAGEIVNKDADPDESGIQVLMAGGKARLSIRSPFEPCEAVIKASTLGLESGERIYFKPDLRPMLFVGSGQIKIGSGVTSGKTSVLSKYTDFQNGYYGDGSGAFFMKGEIAKDTQLTVSYDTEKKKEKELFNTPEKKIESESRYQITGDESKAGSEAQSARPLYARIDHGRNSALFGDFNTDLSQTKLATYTRAFNGVLLKGETEKASGKFFATTTDRSIMVDALPGRGTSGYYMLSRPVIEGSERITIETRDRARSDLVLSREVLKYATDYTLDYFSGAVLLKAPLPSHDGNLNPVYLVATYETEGGAESFYIYGGRATVSPIENLEVSATSVVEEKDIRDYRLEGVDAKLKLPGETTVKAEAARTYSNFDDGKTFSPVDGTAWTVEGETKPAEGLSLRAYYTELSNHFDNPSATEALSGSVKHGAEGRYSYLADSSLRAKYFYEKNTMGDVSHLFYSAGNEITRKWGTFTMEAIREEADANYAAANTDRHSFDSYQDSKLDSTALRAALQYNLTDYLTADLSHRQELDGNNYTISDAGLAYRVSPTQKIYARTEYATTADNRESRTVFGADSNLGKNTVAYQEYRLRDGMEGARSQEMVGLRNKTPVTEHLTASVSAEKAVTVSGDAPQDKPDSFAVSTGVEYLASDKLMTSARAEYRTEDLDDDQSTWLGEVSGLYKLHDDLSMLLRERYFLTSLENGTSRATSLATMGLALRPLKDNRYDALLRLDWRNERDSMSNDDLNLDAYIWSLSGGARVTKKLEVGLKYAGKVMDAYGFSAYTDLWAVKGVYEFAEKWDVGAEYRVLTSHMTGDAASGGSAEIGYRVAKNFWLSMGYDFDRFDTDLKGESYHGEGVFLKLRVKADEQALRPK